MKPFSRVVIAFFCMTCLMCGCTRDISRSEQISERIEQLEKKQDKHNSMIERMYIVEGKITAIESDVSELKGKVL